MNYELNTKISIDELRKRYDKFMTTDEGKAWYNRMKAELPTRQKNSPDPACNHDIDFGDYLYYFYPEVLQ